MESIQASRKCFSVTDYHKMNRAGIFAPNERTELIQGEVVTMSPIGSHHAACVDRLNRIFVKVFPDQVIVRVQNPVRIDDWTELEPDIAVVNFQSDFYKNSHPEPPDVHLIIEVADTTLHYDRKVKLPIYAACGIAEVWLADLTNSNIEIYSSPSESGYETIRIFRKNKPIESSAFPDLHICVDDIV